MTILTAVQVGEGEEAAEGVTELRKSRVLPAALGEGEEEAAPDAVARRPRAADGRTKAAIWASRAIFIATLLFVTLAGLQTLYVTNGLQLGASPLADFLTLVAWGLASDVAGRTLANFMGGR